MQFSISFPEELCSLALLPFGTLFGVTERSVCLHRYNKVRWPGTAGV